MAALPNLRRGIGNRVTTSLSASITDVALTMTVSDATGMNADGGYIMIDEEYSNKREIVYVESITSNTLTISTSGRGLAGTTAVSHDSGATVTDIVVDEHVNGIIDMFSVGHEDNGTHKADSVDTAAIQDEAITTGKILDGAVTTEKRVGGFFVGVIDGATLNSTGNKSISGVGFKPRLVRFTVLNPSSGEGFNPGFGAMDENGNQFASWFSSDPRRNSHTNRCFALGSASETPNLSASYVSMDSDGFTINVHNAFSFSVAYEAYA